MSKNQHLPSSVMFVCTLNSIRSPMAEGIMAEGMMKAKFGDEIYVQSCGLEAGIISNLMVAVMREKGIDMQAHKPKTLAEIADTSFDVVIAFNENAEATVHAVFDDSDTKYMVGRRQTRPDSGRYGCEGHDGQFQVCAGRYRDDN